MALFRKKVDISRYQGIMDRDNYDEIESARETVTPSITEALLKAYWSLPSWDHKRILIELVQDQQHKKMAAVMLDFLSAPISTSDDVGQLAQATALGHQGETYDQFMVYYNDRELLFEDVNKVLISNGMQPHPPQQPVQAPLREISGEPNARILAAVINGDIPALKQALADGAHPGVVTGSGPMENCTTLMRAIMAGHEEAAFVLIEAGASVTRSRSDNGIDPGQTALWWAACRGSGRLAERLIKAGADIEFRDAYGSTPLWEAASVGNAEVLSVLASRSADPDVSYRDGRKALNIAVTNGHTDVVEYLLEMRAKVNHPGNSGYTPLMVAAENGPFAIVRLLIDHGANVNDIHTGQGIYSAFEGMTPLGFAIKGAYSKASQALISAGADPTYVTPAGARYDGRPHKARTMMDHAEASKKPDAMKAILKKAT